LALECKPESTTDQTPLNLGAVCVLIPAFLSSPYASYHSMLPNVITFPVLRLIEIAAYVQYAISLIVGI